MNKKVYYDALLLIVLIEILLLIFASKTILDKIEITILIALIAWFLFVGGMYHHASKRNHGWWHLSIIFTGSIAALFYYFLSLRNILKKEFNSYHNQHQKTPEEQK